jgi:hypothetical protein
VTGRQGGGGDSCRGSCQDGPAAAPGKPSQRADGHEDITGIGEAGGFHPSPDDATPPEREQHSGADGQVPPAEGPGQQPRRRAGAGVADPRPEWDGGRNQGGDAESAAGGAVDEGESAGLVVVERHGAHPAPAPEPSRKPQSGFSLSSNAVPDHPVSRLRRPADQPGMVT